MQPGVTMTGVPLFASYDLERYERETYYTAVEQHLGTLEPGAPLPSDEVLLAMYVEYSCSAVDVRLGQPRSINYRGARTAECLVPYSGSPSWFWFSACTWPRMEPAKGRLVRTNEGEALLLSADVDASFKPWIAVAFAAELARIRHNLTILALVPARINRDFQHRAPFMAEHTKRIWAQRV